MGAYSKINIPPHIVLALETCFKMSKGSLINPRMTLE
jgi:hypothetical protein